MGFSEVSQVWFPSSRAYDGDSCWRGFIEVCSQRNLQEVMGQEREEVAEQACDFSWVLASALSHRGFWSMNCTTE